MAIEKSLLWIGGLIAGAGALFYIGSKMSPATAAASTTPPGTVPSGSTYPVTLAAGTFSIQVNTNEEIDLNLPSGASWVDNSSNISSANQNGLANVNIPSSGSAMGSVVFSGIVNSTTLTLNWKDSSGNSQTTTLQITST